MKILILWSHISGYLEDSLCALAKTGAEIHLVHFGIDSNAPFQKRELPTGIKLYDEFYQSMEEWNKFKRLISPDIVLMSGWNHRFYRKLERLSSEKWVICFDTQLRFSSKHALLAVYSRFTRQFRTDCAFVPGERQAMLAILMGFKPKYVFKGLYTIDTKRYFLQRESINREFIFVGRLVPEKGIKELLQAYEKYRDSVSSPWNLRICGQGPLLQINQGQGIIWDGFTQPEMLVKKLHSAGVFVLPSVFEPWGVVVSEAAASGLPIIASAYAGAAASLVIDNWNGKIIRDVNSEKIYENLLEFHNMPLETYLHYSGNSLSIASQVDVEIFVQVIFDLLKT